MIQNPVWDGLQDVAASATAAPDTASNGVALALAGAGIAAAVVVVASNNNAGAAGEVPSAPPTPSSGAPRPRLC